MGGGVKVILVISNSQQPFIVLVILTLSEPCVRSSRKQKRLSDVDFPLVYQSVCKNRKGRKPAVHSQNEGGKQTLQQKQRKIVAINVTRTGLCSAVQCKEGAEESLRNNTSSKPNMYSPAQTIAPSGFTGT